MNNSKGFKKLKGLASIGAMSFAGLFGAGSGRAGTTTGITTGFTIGTGSAIWSDFGNNSSFPSSTTVTTTNGNSYATFTEAFCYADATVLDGSTTYNDAFDCAMILAVEGNLFINPDSTVDLTGTTVTSDVVTDIIPPISAQVEYRVYTDRRLIRGLFTLTNTPVGPIGGINVTILGDYGSDSGTNVVTTSNSDNLIENTDLWYITDDNLDTGKTSQAQKVRGFNGDPVITTTRHGVNAEVVPFNALTPVDDGAVYGLRYPVNIPAGGTVRIMTFHEIGPNNVAAIPDQIAAASDFESMTALDAAGLIDDLDQSVRDTIVNYGDSDIIFKNGFESN